MFQKEKDKKIFVLKYEAFKNCIINFVQYGKFDVGDMVVTKKELKTYNAANNIQIQVDTIMKVIQISKTTGNYYVRKDGWPNDYWVHKSDAIHLRREKLVTNIL